MPTNDKDVQVAELGKDQQRLKDYYANLYQTRKKELVGGVSDVLAKTPSYRKERKKSVALSGAGGATVGLASLLRGRKAALIGVPAGALLGMGAGALQSHRKLKRSATNLTQLALLKSMGEEGKKNVMIHSYLAQPGTQKLVVKRPWGTEKYEG